MSRSLPDRPDLRHLRNQAKRLYSQYTQAAADALARISEAHPRLSGSSHNDLIAATLTLQDCQLVIAREYGFDSWQLLVEGVRSSQTAPSYSVEELIQFFLAIRRPLPWGQETVLRADDVERVEQLLARHPSLVDARVEEESLTAKSMPERVRETPHPRGEGIVSGLHLPAAGFYRGASPTDLAMAKLLLDAGADVDDPAHLGGRPCAPIMLAAWEGGIEMMRLLLDHGAEVRGDAGRSALRQAASHNTIDRFDLLVEHGAPVSLALLIQAGFDDRVLSMVESSPDLLRQTDDDGYTVLQRAAASTSRWDGDAAAGHRLTRALVDKGAPFDLFAAAALDDVTRVQELLVEDVDSVATQLKDGTTAVHVAVNSGSIDALRLLLASGRAQIETDTSLELAARLGDTEICRLLVDHGALVTDRVMDAAAWAGGSAELMALLLVAGGDTNPKQGWSGSRIAIHWLCGRSSAEAVQVLVEGGADVDAPGDHGDTPLHEAIRRSSDNEGLAIAELLLTAGADPTSVNDDGETPLERAMNEGNARAADLLRRHTGNEVTSMDNKLTRAFEAREGRKLTKREVEFLDAAAHGYVFRRSKAISDVGRMGGLLSEEPSLLNTAGPLALNHAISGDAYDGVRFLLDRGVRDIYDSQTDRPREDQHCAITHAFYEGMEENGELPAEQVTRAGRFRILRALIEAGVADTSAISTSHVGWPGNTSLLYWAVYRRHEFIEFALEFGADPEAPISGHGERGTTVLQHAVAPWDDKRRWQRGLDTAELLLSRGAYYDIFSACGRDDLDRLRELVASDREAVTRPGEANMTPLHWAVRAGATKCANWLLTRGADVDAATVTHRTSLHMAAEFGNTDMIWLLAGLGADLDMQDTKGRTALHRATYTGKVEAAEALIVLGANPRLETKTGKTALQSARFDCKFLKER